MSSVPSGLVHCSSTCRRSATHTPPVWMPTISVSGVRVGAMASASRAISVWASGSEACIEEPLQNELCGDGIRQRLVFLAVDAACMELGFGCRAGVALVHQKNREIEAGF